MKLVIIARIQRKQERLKGQCSRRQTKKKKESGYCPDRTSLWPSLQVQRNPCLMKFPEGFYHVVRHRLRVLARFTLQSNGLCWTGGHAQPTANAPIKIQNRTVIYKLEGFHLTTVYAGSAAFTAICMDQRQEMRGHNLGRCWVHFDVFKDLATATATTADVDHIFSVAGLENKPRFICLF